MSDASPSDRCTGSAAVAGWELDTCCHEAFDIVEEAFWAFVEHGGEAEVDRRAVIEALSHGEVAPAFADHVLWRHDSGHEQLGTFAHRVSAGVSKGAAAARLVAAVGSEYRGETLEAEAELRAAVREDPAYGPAASELAQYELDRGELRQALALLHHPDLPPDDPTLEILEGLQADLDAPYRGVGRNDMCPCGSGRKFKACCLNNRRIPLSARTGLLTHRLAQYSARARHRDELIGVAYSACDPDDDEHISTVVGLIREPLIADFVVFEGGVAQEYLAERGAMLLDDERDLLGRLVQERRRLWEVVAVDAGTSLTLRDTATGETLEVRERLGSEGRDPGELLLARVARLDDQNQLVGVPLAIPLRLRDSTLHLVDSDPDADMLASWYGSAIALPPVVNREDEELMLCRAELLTDASMFELHRTLDAVLTPDDEGVWHDLWTEPGGEEILRGTVEHVGDRLVIETNSVARLERVLDAVTTALPDATLVVDERVDLRDAASARGESHERTDEATDPELDAALQEYIERKEEEWINEAVPALGGLTPRQALDDPTRREDLLALLRDFERVSAPPGGRGFDATRLRKQLGLSPPA